MTAAQRKLLVSRRNARVRSEQLHQRRRRFNAVQSARQRELSKRRAMLRRRVLLVRAKP